MNEPVNKTVDRLFRHEAGKMIAVLTRLLGFQHVQTAQDIVQETLLQALHTWPRKGQPDNPAAWLYRVAKNKAVDHSRREKKFSGVRAQHALLLQPEPTDFSAPFIFEPHEIEDSQLRMICACCHPSIPVDSQIAFALKTLCGLSVEEIAKAFLKEEETISKRIYRAKEKIRSENIQMEMPGPAELPSRLDAVLHCLYLLFNEGYNSGHPEMLIREDLCEEAMRMTFMLTLNPHTNAPRTNALLALFCFQASRFRERTGANGNIVLLGKQDRSKWYRPLIEKGCAFLELATREETSAYHLEAAIAYLHIIPANYENTDWKAIYYLYEILAESKPGPVVMLHKAIAASFAVGPRQALDELRAITELDQYYLYHTAVGQALLDTGNAGQAEQSFLKALTMTSSNPEKMLLREKINDCSTRRPQQK